MEESLKIQIVLDIIILLTLIIFISMGTVNYVEEKKNKVRYYIIIGLLVSGIIGYIIFLMIKSYYLELHLIQFIRDLQ